MTLHISEAEVRAVLTMPLAVEAMEEISRKQATGEVVVHPRRRFELPGGGFFHYMAAADFSSGFVAMKQYTFVRGKLRFLVPLYEMATGDLLALIEADYMGQLRTGAASGVDIVCTATTSSQPVVSGADLAPGAHINAIGANHAHKRELDDEAVASADIIVVDSVEQSRQEAGDLIIAFHGDEICWTGVKKLSEIVAGKASGRTSDTEVTLFKSNGIASWDLAVAMKVYAMAREKKLGRELPLWSDGAKS